MLNFLQFSIFGYLRRIYFRVTNKEVIITGTCQMCGRCCKRINLTLKENSTWIRSMRAFEKLKRAHPEYERFVCVDRSPTGILIFNCGCLDENNLCGDYDNRPAFCRLYPSKKLYFMGGEFMKGCGYRFEVVPRFSRMLKKKIAENKQTE